VRFSASSLTLWSECQRKWAYRYLDGIEAPPNASAKRGTAAHALLASYLSGDPVDLPPWLRVGIPHLPEPRSCTVEGQLTFTLRGHGFIGYRDFADLTRTPPLVGDHKTTRTIGRYTKKAADLRDDYQAAIYAADAMVATGQRECDLLWLYYQAEGEPACRPVTVRLTVADVEPVLERAVAAADVMAQLVELGAKAKDLPPTGVGAKPRSICDSYGGCPYIAHCNLTTEERLFPMSESSNETLERLKAAAAAKKAAPPPPPPPPGAKGVNPPPPPPPPPPPAPLVGGRVTDLPIPPPAPKPARDPLPSACAGSTLPKPDPTLSRDERLQQYLARKAEADYWKSTL
jgi:hypothetical protein